MTQPDPYDGQIVVTWNGPVVEHAPARSRISLELVHTADPRGFTVHGDTITIGRHVDGGPVTYRVTGWDAASRCLLVERACICPQYDVTTYGEQPGTRTVPGYDPACPVCPKPTREGEALGVTNEQRDDPHKHFGDMRDRIGALRQQRAEQDGGDRG